MEPLFREEVSTGRGGGEGRGGAVHPGRDCGAEGVAESYRVRRAPPAEARIPPPHLGLPRKTYRCHFPPLSPRVNDD